jgi:hypothetical protein
MTGAGAGGGERIIQCSSHNNDWCCNGDNVNVHCCEEKPEPRPFFALQDGKAYATVGSNTASTAPDLAGITGLATSGGSGGGGGSGSKTSAPASSDGGSSTAGSSAATATAESVSTTAKPFTSTKESVTSDSTGGLKTVSVLVTITPTSPSDPSNTAVAAAGSSSGSSSKLGVIIGCAVGIPLALALVGIIFWLLRKRRNTKANPYKESPEMEGGDAAFVGGAAGKLSKKQTFRNSHPGTTEIDGNPVGAGQRISAVKNHAELPSGDHFQPGQGTPYAPGAVGIGGGNSPGRNTWGSVPPQYSPAHNQTAFQYGHPAAAELDASGTGVLPVVNEKIEGQQQYIPYRPPQPMAEMPTVTTPPEDVERQMHHR